MITEDAILKFIPTRVSGTGFGASKFTQFGLNLSSGSGSDSVSGSGFRLFHTPNYSTLESGEKMWKSLFELVTWSALNMVL